MGALEPDPVTDTPDPTNGEAPGGGGGTGSVRELVPVMDPDAGNVPAGVLINAAVLATAPVALESGATPASGDDAPASDEREPVAVAAVASDTSSAGSVAARVLRALTSWTSPAPTGGPQKH
jgi:hypothetical protein